jgi:replicative DNA helicase
MSDVLNPSAKLISWIMRDPDLMSQPFIASMPTEAFWPDHGIFSVMKKLHESGEPPTAAALTTYFRRMGAIVDDDISQPRLLKLAETDPYADRPEDLAQMSLEIYERREVMTRLENIKRGLLDGESIATVKEKLQNQIIDAQITNLGAEATLAEIVDRVLERRFRELEGVRHGLPGLSDPDAWPLLVRGQVVALGGVTKTGKSAAVQQIVNNAIMVERVPTLFCPLEIRDVAAVDQMIASMAGVASTKFGKRLSEPERKKLYQKGEELKQAPLFVSGSRNIFDIAAKAKLYQAQLVVIDQLSHTSGLREKDYKSRTYMIEDYMSIIIERIAHRLNASVIVVFQVKRESIGRRPTVADVGESKSIFEASDQGIFVHRPDRNGSEVEWIVDVNRWGPTSISTARYDGPNRRFVPILNNSTGARE